MFQKLLNHFLFHPSKISISLSSSALVISDWTRRSPTSPHLDSVKSESLIKGLQTLFSVSNDSTFVRQYDGVNNIRSDCKSVCEFVSFGTKITGIVSIKI